MTRDPQAPVGLRRDPRPDRRRGRRSRSVILGQPAAHAAGLGAARRQGLLRVEAELSTAQAVTPGQGQTVNIAGVQVGEISQRRAQGRQGDLGMGSSRSTPRLPGRHRAAAAQDRPQGHGRRARRPARATPGGCPRASRSRSPDAARRQPRRDPRLARRRHARLPADAAQRRRPRALRRQRPRSWRDTIRRFEPTATLPARGQRARSRMRRRNIARVVHNFSLLTGELGSKDDAARRRSSRTPTPCSPRSRSQDANLRATLRELPGALRRRRRRRSARSSRLGRRRSARRCRRCGPAPARSGRRCGRRGRSCARRRRSSATRSARSCAPRCPTVKELRPALRDLAAATPDLTRSFKVVNALLNALAYNPPGAGRGLPVLALVAQPPRPTDVLDAGRARPDPPRPRRAVSCQHGSAARASSLGEPAARHARRSCSNAPSAEQICPDVEGRCRCRRRRPPSAGSPRWSCSRCRASGCCCSCGSRSAARCRSSRRATASRRRSPRPRSSPRRPTCGSPACRSARSRRSSPTSTTGRSVVDDRARQSRYAPLPSDARAILRQKTLLGETYVELTPGHAGRAKRSPRAGALADGAGLRHGRARRDPALVRPAHARGVPGLDADAGAGDRRRTGATSTTRSATSRPFAEDAARLVDILNRQQGAVQRPDLQHRRRVRRADRARRPAARR